MNPTSKVFVAGHRGLVGSAIVDRLRHLGYSSLILKTHAELDLEDQHAVAEFFSKEKPEYVFLAAAKVGGILANSTYPGEFIYRNLAIQNNVIHSAWENRAIRLLFLGSSCIYPRECPQPIKEEYLLSGPLEPTNRPYAVAKIAGIEMCWSYNRQYNTQFVAVMPTNLYGIGDNYDLSSSHVLPAIIRKCHLAKLAREGELAAIQANERALGPIPTNIKNALGLINDASSLDANISPRPVFWGTGTPRREFLHNADMADACIHVMNMNRTNFQTLLTESSPPLINIGSGEDRTVAECVDLVKRVVGYTGDVCWDGAKPDGTPQKRLDMNKLKALGWEPKIGFHEGVRSAYSDYLQRVEGQ